MNATPSSPGEAAAAFPNCFIRPIAYREPLALCASVADRPGTVWLDSADRDHPSGRRSLLAFAPRLIESFAAGSSDNPFDWLKQAMSGTPDYASIIGMLGYEAGRFADRMLVPKDRLGNLPEAWWGIYDAVAVFDHPTQTAFVAASGWPEAGPSREETARARAESFVAHLVPAPIKTPAALLWRPERTPDSFAAAVAETIEWIRRGDIYQANLSLRFFAPNLCADDIFGLYARLRAQAPAPFGAYLRLDSETALLSASPERFLQCSKDGVVRTQPIKGTRPRRSDPRADRIAVSALMQSPKERAENLMIVDLLRNDLSRVCAPGSVSVPSLFAVETFATVHHLVSTVEGRLAAGRTLADLLQATFPGGSITGAPKIRAMELIRDLEKGARGAYCGSLVCLMPDGSMDSSILIRTLTAVGGQIIAQAGSGIVADSEPEAEVRETWLKAKALLRTLNPASESPLWE